MRSRQPERPRLRKREIAFAVAAGVVAAGGAALMIDSGTGSPPAVVIAGQNKMAYELSQFDEISTVGPQDVVVTLGDTFSVRSEGSPEALAQFETTVDGGTLTIRPRRGFNWGNWRRLTSATFYVTLPKLDRVASAGSGDIRIDRVEGESFDGAIAGSGTLTIGAMQVNRAAFSIGGNGDVVVAGTAGDTRVAIGGSGTVSGRGLNSGTASVSIGGSGDVALHVEDQANVSILGSGDVDISGPARCSVTRMGSGDVDCEGGGGTDD